MAALWKLSVVLLVAPPYRSLNFVRPAWIVRLRSILSPGRVERFLFLSLFLSLSFSHANLFQLFHSLAKTCVSDCRLSSNDRVLLTGKDKEREGKERRNKEQLWGRFENIEKEIRWSVTLSICQFPLDLIVLQPARYLVRPVVIVLRESELCSRLSQDIYGCRWWSWPTIVQIDWRTRMSDTLRLSQCVCVCVCGWHYHCWQVVSPSSTVHRFQKFSSMIDRKWAESPLIFHPRACFCVACRWVCVCSWAYVCAFVCLFPNRMIFDLTTASKDLDLLWIPSAFYLPPVRDCWKSHALLLGGNHFSVWARRFENIGRMSGDRWRWWQTRRWRRLSSWHWSKMVLSTRWFDREPPSPNDHSHAHNLSLESSVTAAVWTPSPQPLVPFHPIGRNIFLVCLDLTS